MNTSQPEQSRNGVDGDRLTALFSENAADLLRYFLRRSTSVDDAADLLGEVFLIATRRQDSIPDGPERGRMWLFVSARHLLSNSSRAMSRNEALIGALVHAAGVMVNKTELDEAIGVRAAVESLPRRERELIKLVHWDGFSIVEAARVMGERESTARGQYQRAKKKLRLLVDTPPEPDLFSRPQAIRRS